MLNKINMRSFSAYFFHLNLDRSRALLLLLGLGIGLTGCYRSIPPNFYTLTPKITPLVSSNVKLIEVVPIGLPQRLNTPLFVLQDTNGQSYKLDNQRWTSNLSNELQSGLSAGLQQKLGAIDVYNTGMTGGKASYVISTEFSRFDIVEHANKEATEIEVMASWIIKRKDPATISQTSPTEKTIEYPQLNCRIAFKNKVVGHSNYFLDIVNTYQDSLNRIVDAIAASTIAVDAKKVPSIEGVVCS